MPLPGQGTGTKDEPAIRHRVLGVPPHDQRPYPPPANDGQPDEHRQPTQPDLSAARRRQPCRAAGDHRPDHEDEGRPEDLLPVRPELHHDLLVAAEQPSRISHDQSLHPRWGIVTAKYAPPPGPGPRRQVGMDRNPRRGRYNEPGDRTWMTSPAPTLRSPSSVLTTS